MAERQFIVLEDSDFDNGYLDNAAELYDAIGEDPIRAKSLEDMIDQLLERLEDGDCIKQLTIVGHGNEGYISIGAGRGSAAGKGMGRGDGWQAKLRRLKKHMCPESFVRLNGCYVGAGRRGSAFLKEVADILGSVVQAQNGKKWYRAERVNWWDPFRSFWMAYQEGHRWQGGLPGEPPLPPIPKL